MTYLPKVSSEYLIACAVYYTLVTANFPNTFWKPVFCDAFCRVQFFSRLKSIPRLYWGRGGKGSVVVWDKWGGGISDSLREAGAFIIEG